MITGGAYIVATIVLALLMKYGSREPHQKSDNEDFFRYPKTVRYMVMFGVVVWLGAILFIRLATPKPSDTPMIMNIETTMLAIMLIGHAIIAVYCNRFYLAVTSDGIRWGGFKIRSLLFSEMNEIEVYNRDKGRKWLTFYGPDDLNLLRVTNYLQEFEDLVDLVRENGRKVGVGFEEKTLPFF
jgi:hypothetical protein